MKTILTVLLATLTLVGCGDAINLPANYKAIVIDKDTGPDFNRTYSGTSLYIPYGFLERDRALSVETSQGAYSFSADVPINASNGLPVTFKFNLVFRLREDMASYQKAVAGYRSQPSKLSSYLRYISTENMARITLAPIAVDTASNVINGLNMSIEDIMLNMPAVRDSVRTQFDQIVAESPIEIMHLTMDNPIWPESVISRKQDLQKIKDDEKIQLDRLAMEKRQLDKEHAFALVKATKQLELDEKYATRYDGPNGEMLLKQQVVKVMETCAEKETGCNIVITEGLAPWK
ncbi:hypothetical protein [Vibrio phage BONAISHI]|nr:hypothetical protein [Vibrio phage BONAISHI]